MPRRSRVVRRRARSRGRAFTARAPVPLCGPPRAIESAALAFPHGQGGARAARAVSRWDNTLRVRALGVHRAPCGTRALAADTPAHLSRSACAGRELAQRDRPEGGEGAARLMRWSWTSRPTLPSLLVGIADEARPLLKIGDVAVLKCAKCGSKRRWIAAPCLQRRRRARSAGSWST